MEKLFIKEELSEIIPVLEEVIDDSRETLIAAAGSKEVFKGICVKADEEGNVYVLYGNTHCIMPKDMVTWVKYDTGEVNKGYSYNLVGKCVTFRVSKVEKGNIYIDRKSVVTELRDYLNSNLKVGQIIEGQVTNISEAVFVNIGADYTGIIPVRYLEHMFVVDMKYHVQEGDTIKAAVQEIVKDSDGNIKEIILNRKVMLPPYQELMKEYSIGDVVMGTVKDITRSCIFLNLNEHVDASCRFDGKMYKRGQKVVMKINTISYSNGKITGRILSSL